MPNLRTKPDDRPRLLYVVDAPRTLAALRGQLRYMAAAGFDVAVAAPGGPELDAAVAEAGVTPIPLALEGWLGPLLALRKIMLERRPHITHAAGLGPGAAAGLAVRLAKVPIRIYAHLEGPAPNGWRARLAERIACSSAQRVLCLSESVRRRLELRGLVARETSTVLGAGSLAGVEGESFAASGERVAHGKRLRRELGIADTAPVVGYSGELSASKGTPELLEAYARLQKTVTGVRLLIVGEKGAGALPAAAQERLQSLAGIVFTGRVPDAAPYYHVIDVLALPSHGESFPENVLAAYAAGKPVVASRAPGVVDAVMEEGTGLLVPVGDVQALADALDTLLKSPETRHDMGEAGRRWVARDFRPVRLWRELEKEYRRLLEERGLPLPAREPVTTGFLNANA